MATKAKKADARAKGKGTARDDLSDAEVAELHADLAATEPRDANTERQWDRSWRALKRSETQQDRIEAAFTALEDLDDDELVTVVVTTLGIRAHADAPRGLVQAIAVAVESLLESPLEAGSTPPDELTARTAMAERVASVGRGVHLKSTHADDAPLLRELAHLAQISGHWVTEQRARDLTARLESWRNAWRPSRRQTEENTRDVDWQAVANALAKPTLERRVADLAVASGLLSDRDKAYRKARSALKNM